MRHAQSDVAADNLVTFPTQLFRQISRSRSYLQQAGARKPMTPKKPKRIPLSVPVAVRCYRITEVKVFPGALPRLEKSPNLCFSIQEPAHVKKNKLAGSREPLSTALYTGTFPGPIASVLSGNDDGFRTLLLYTDLQSRSSNKTTAVNKTYSVVAIFQSLPER